MMYNYNLSNEDMRKLDYYNYKNNNYNQPLYTENANANSLYDPYQGFIRGNLFKGLYNSYKLNKPLEVEPMNEQAELLTYIDAYGFACNDIALYLDIYEKDKDMLDLFNRYRIENSQLVKRYEDKYGPLSRSSDANTREWAWNNRPWPWENK